MMPEPTLESRVIRNFAGIDGFCGSKTRFVRMFIEPSKAIRSFANHLGHSNEPEIAIAASGPSYFLRRETIGGVIDASIHCNTMKKQKCRQGLIAEAWI